MARRVPGPSPRNRLGSKRANVTPSQRGHQVRADFDDRKHLYGDIHVMTPIKLLISFTWRLMAKTRRYESRNELYAMTI